MPIRTTDARIFINGREITATAEVTLTEADRVPPPTGWGLPSSKVSLEGTYVPPERIIDADDPDLDAKVWWSHMLYGEAWVRYRDGIGH